MGPPNSRLQNRNFSLKTTHGYLSHFIHCLDHRVSLYMVTAELQRRMQAMTMRCYCKILCISYKDHVTNEKVRAKTQQAIGPHKDLTIIRDANCSGMVMFPVHQVWPKPSFKAQWKGKDDKTDRGRDGKTPSGNRQAWSSPSPRGQQRNREKWSKLVVKSSVVP